MTSAVTFEQADIQDCYLEPDRYDTVLMECVLSTLDRKPETLERLCQMLPSGGKIALTDVTVNGQLPPEMNGVVASAMCIGDALSHDEYVEIICTAGFEVVVTEDVNHVAVEFVERLRAALLMAEAAVGLGKLDVSIESIRQVREIVKIARSYVEDGTLSYGLIVGEKP